jgi:hypothetical protein
MRVKFMVGDWSHDGHSQDDSFIVDVNLTQQELDAAFLNGCALMELDAAQCKSLSFLFCNEYEDSTIPQKFIDGMNKVGLDPDNYFENYDGKYSGETNTFHLLWLDVAKIGNPNLVYQECVSDRVYRIGGYGLYSC